MRTVWVIDPYHGQIINHAVMSSLTAIALLNINYYGYNAENRALN